MGGTRQLGSIAAASSLALALVRCASFSSPSADATPAPANPADAAEIDAGEAAAGATSLLTNGTFDKTCQSWLAFQGTLTADPDGRTGPGCRVCVKPGVTNLFSINAANLPAQLGTWDGEIWVRALADAGGAGKSILPVLRTYDDPANAGSHVEYQEASPTPLGTDWTRLFVTLTATQPANYIGFYAYMPKPTDGMCFVVDDAKLVFTPP